MTTTATFTRNISQSTLKYLNSLPFKTWDCFQTPERNLGITEYADIERPTQRIFRDFESKHEIRFTVNTDGVVSVNLRGAGVWTPYAVELTRLLMLHDVKHPNTPTYAEAQSAAHEAKVTELSSMEYADLVRLYNSVPEAPKRRGLKKDRASLVRRLAKIM